MENDINKKLRNMLGDQSIINHGEQFNGIESQGGQWIERIVSIPIYADDDYTSIAYRFLKEYGDLDVIDGFRSFKHNP
jgi:hypothetical protein